MSKKGRRIRTAEENKKKEFRKMFEFLAMGVVALCILIVDLSYQPPEYAQLERFSGQYQSMERRSSGRRRSDAFGLILEDGSSFYIHQNFNREAFEANVNPGDELIILADTERHFLIHHTSEPVVYELRETTGEKFRDYEKTLAYMQRERRRYRIIYALALFAMLESAFMCFWNWRKYSRMIQEHEERKKA